MSDVLDKVKADIRTDIIRKNGLLEEKEIEELTSDSLRQWMETSLPANIKQQIQLDAMHTTKDIPQEQMLDQYMKTRQNQYQQTVEMIQKYQERLPYLDEEGIKDYNTLVRKARVIEDNLRNAPTNPEEAYNAWVNDYYNSYLTGQSDFYAYKKEKSKVQSDPFSLAAYNSRLKRQEDYYKEVTLAEEKRKRGLTTPTTSASGKDLTTQLETAEILNNWFPKVTNGLTKDTTYKKLAANTLSEEDSSALKEALKESLFMYASTPGSKVKIENIPSDIDLTNVEVKMNPDGTYVFRVDTGEDNIVYEVLQDKFDDAVRKTQDLEDVDYQYSVDSRYTRNQPVNTQGISVDSELAGAGTPTLDSASSRAYYEGLAKEAEKQLQ